MSPILVVIVVSAAVVALVLIGSLYVISKGYAYKQKVDPLPEEEGTGDRGVRTNHEEDDSPTK